MTVRDSYPGLGHQFPKAAGHFFDIANPVVNKENLALSQQFPADGFSHGPLVVLADIGEDRPAVSRRRGNERQIPEPVKLISSVRGIGEAVIVRTSTSVLNCLDRFLVGYAKALLLVDDQQTEILELDILPATCGCQ